MSSKPTTKPGPEARDPRDDREFVASMVMKLPVGTTLEQIQYHVGVAALLRERERKYDEAMALGVEEATRRGLLLTSEQVEEAILSWRRK